MLHVNAFYIYNYLSRGFVKKAYLTRERLSKKPFDSIKTVVVCLVDKMLLLHSIKYS